MRSIFPLIVSRIGYVSTVNRAELVQFTAIALFGVNARTLPFTCTRIIIACTCASEDCISKTEKKSLLNYIIAHLLAFECVYVCVRFQF